MNRSTHFAKHALCSVIFAGCVGVSVEAQAGMGNLGNNYGIFPMDVASAQSLSMFNDQVSTTYYNPAFLAKDTRGELTAGAMHAEQELRAKGADRNGDVLSKTPSQHLVIGLKTDLSDLTRSGHPIYLGFIAGVDKFSRDLLAFKSETSESGQFLTYGRQPLFLIIGGGTKIWRGIDAGFATRTTLHSQAELTTRTDLAGNTQYEKLNVSAKPSIRSIASVNVDIGATLCPDSECWATGLETALTFRTSSTSKTTVDANTVIPGLIPSSDPLNFTVSTLDSYQPSAYGLGVHYTMRHWRFGLSVEQQNWSDLGEAFKGDTVKDQAQAEFDDIIIPRIGAAHRISEHFTLVTGLAYQQSPLKSTSTQDVNYFDNDKYIAGLGISAEFKRTYLFAHPVRFDLGYQYQMLKSRDFTINNSQPGNTNNGVVVEASGDVQVISGSMTLKF